MLPHCFYLITTPVNDSQKLKVQPKKIDVQIRKQIGPEHTSTKL